MRIPSQLRKGPLLPAEEREIRETLESRETLRLYLPDFAEAIDLFDAKMQELEAVDPKACEEPKSQVDLALKKACEHLLGFMSISQLKSSNFENSDQAWAQLRLHLGPQMSMSEFDLDWDSSVSPALDSLEAQTQVLNRHLETYGLQES